MNNKLASQIQEQSGDGKEARQLVQQKRSADPALSELGVKQAVACGKALTPNLTGHIVVWVSPFLRTLQTATAIDSALRPVAGQYHLEYYVHAGCFENGGCYFQAGGVDVRGMSPTAIATSFPKFSRFLPAEWPAEQGWMDFYNAGQRTSLASGKESEEEFVERSKRLVQEIWAFASTHKSSRTLALVAHGDLLDMLLNLLVIGNPAHPVRFVHDNTGITSLALDPETRTCFLLEVNSSMHLVGDDEILVPDRPNRLFGYER